MAGFVFRSSCCVQSCCLCVFQGACFLTWWSFQKTCLWEVSFVIVVSPQASGNIEQSWRRRFRRRRRRQARFRRPVGQQTHSRGTGRIQKQSRKTSSIRGWASGYHHRGWLVCVRDLTVCAGGWVLVWTWVCPRCLCQSVCVCPCLCLVGVCLGVSGCRSEESDRCHCCA